MSDSEDVRDQYNRQKEFERYKRRRHGQETDLDRAEEVHDAIWDRVWWARSGMPIVLTFLFGGVGAEVPASAWIIANLSLWIALYVANILGRIADLTSGTFRPTIWMDVENFFFGVFGIGIALLGVACHGPGVVATGIVLTLTPPVWGAWSRHIMSQTDFTRLRAELYSEPSTPRIVE